MAALRIALIFCFHISNGYIRVPVPRPPGGFFACLYRLCRAEMDAP
jgi:hypothetical protein